MPMMPARVKYRKMHRGSRTGLATRGQSVAFGEYGLQSLERCWLDTKQIEAARVAVTRFMKRRGKVWIRVFPDKSFTKKPLETRMGKGKGPLESWVAVIRPANILIEVDGVTEAVARESLRLLGPQTPHNIKIYLPTQTRVRKRYENVGPKVKGFHDCGIDGHEPRFTAGNVQPAAATGEQ